MHIAARGARDVLGIFVALAFLGCVLAVPTAAGAASNPEPAVAAADHAELVRLAEQAKAAFRRRMEPPPIRILVLDMQRRDRTAIVRDYARESYEAAIDALLAEARTPERARAVKTALRQLVNNGRPDLAEAIFKEMLERKAAEGDHAKRDAAAAARHSVALAELPQALAQLIEPPIEPLPFPLLGRKAGPAYVRAAELDPDDPWTWIVLAQLAQLADTREALDRAIQNAEKAAQNAGDRRAMIAALHVFGLAHTTAGRHAQAEQAYTRALALAREWTDSAPTSVAAQRYLALGFSRLGDTLKEQRRYEEAARAYQEAVALRHRLAEAEPDDPQRQIDLSAAHMNLWALSDERDDKAFLEASRIHDALLARAPFDPRINPLQSGAVANVLVQNVLIFAGALTLPVGLIALARYRRVIVRWMKAAAEAGATDRPVTTIPRAHLVQEQSEIPLLSVEAPERASRFRSAAIAGAARASRRAAWVYTVAGLAFASVSTVLQLQLSGTEITWPRMIGTVLPWAWPVVITLALLWGRIAGGWDSS